MKLIYSRFSRILTLLVVVLCNYSCNLKQGEKVVLESPKTSRIERINCERVIFLDVLDRLASDTSFLVREAVAQNPNTPIETLIRLTQDSNRDVRLSVLLNPISTSEIRSRLLHDKDEYIRYVAEMYERTNMLDFLRGTVLGEERMTERVIINYLSMSRIRNQIVGGVDLKLGCHMYLPNYNIPLALQEKVVMHSNDLITLISMARNPMVSPKYLQYLSRCVDGRIRESVALNRSASAELLHQLAGDKSSRVRYFVASNPRTALLTLQKLADDESSLVKSGVALNNNTPSDLLEKLMGSFRKIKYPSIELDTTSGIRVAESIASNPNTPVDILNFLSKEKSPNIRAGLGMNPNIPIYLLQKLSGDSFADVRRAIASNMFGLEYSDYLRKRE